MKLVLEDGTEFFGESQGYELKSGEDRVAELVFNTSHTGYVEVATDPSYADQFILFTAPHVGNYGVHRGQDESLRVHSQGIICKDATAVGHDPRSVSSFSEYLKEHRVPLLHKIDTRSLTLKIRQQGSMRAWMGAAGVDRAQCLKRMTEYPSVHPILTVTTQANVQFPGRKERIVLLDYGYKKSIVRQLLARDCEVIVVRASASLEEVLSYRPQGIVLSNGPGDPGAADWTLPVIQGLQARLPLLGICMGHQLFALANGAKTFKLPFGHRGGNHPVRDPRTGRTLMTAQNHSYAVDAASLPGHLQWTYRHLNDESVEGLQHKSLRATSVQFHPEAAPGPWDASFIFDDFLTEVRRGL
jgi:carbamoyl-phosphate synthase small subunit